jgi:hypothetical protein
MMRRARCVPQAGVKPDGFLPAKAFLMPSIISRSCHAKDSREISFVFDAGQPEPVSDSLVLENAVIDFP